jgi:hypothetical protein
MKAVLFGLVLAAPFLLLPPAPVAADDVKIDPGRYAAIAFSPKTRNYGLAWNRPGRASAEKAALAACDADDAQVLTWVQFGWAALVIAEDGAYGFAEVHGPGATEGAAEQEATERVRTRTVAKVKTVVIVCSGDADPRIIKK